MSLGWPGNASGSPLEELEEVSGVTGQTKSGSQAHHEQKNIKDRYVARIGVTGGPTLEPGLGLGARRRVRLVAGSLPTGPGRAGLSPKWRRGPAFQ
ncbi:hypothetical protein L3Q82_006320 [Scortum barcoo]|uniref:Uncharacterized protein n=1 Tax=Scortum barcoo TaxID=214431 RepID=A0ACB8X348_9TELE|nr:hypothetical protein L3Q82_006320 [Scortum barcoo]